MELRFVLMKLRVIYDVKGFQASMETRLVYTRTVIIMKVSARSPAAGARGQRQTGAPTALLHSQPCWVER